MLCIAPGNNLNIRMLAWTCFAPLSARSLGWGWRSLLELLEWICPRAFIPRWVPRRVSIPLGVPPDQALSSTSPRRPRCSGNLASLATSSISLGPTEVVASSASPPRRLAHQSKLPASRSRRPRDHFSGQIHPGASIPRSVPRRVSIRSRVPLAC